MNSGMSAFPYNSGVCFDGHPERFEESMKNKRLLISIVDDDESIRESLPDLIKEFGYAVQTFPSAGEFLASDYLSKTQCLILDVAMPGMTGPDLQRELSIQGKNIPIIFVTGYRDETVRPRLLKEGAVECLYKPFSDADLLAALNAALQVK
jgi:FixJ family two-component response regulator